jgi:UDP-GlcNAc:undecaprenyl-phosphate GlcNAc-1-phosphate transferase
MGPNLLVVALSFTLCVVLTPAVRTLAIQNGWYDMPGDLKIHSSPIPRLGGISLMVGILVGTMFSPPASRMQGAVLLILAAVWTVGLLDDLKGTSPFLRLGVDFACGAVVWLLGWKLQWFSNPYVDFAATVVFLAFTINSMNFVDGMDGLALTVSGVASIGFILLFSGAPVSFTSGLSWSLVAVCAALLIYNRPPARIFIGDSGSTLIGAVLAILALDWVRTAPATHSILVPIAFLGLPLGDAFAAVVRRLRGRQSLVAGDRRHFYDLLLRRGWSVRRILVFSAVATLILAVVSLSTVRGYIDYRILVPGCIGLYGFFALRLGSFEPESPAVRQSVSQPSYEPTASQP